MYHERQHLMHCAMHALNNLFQEAWADRALMEGLAAELCDREAALRSESGMRPMLINPFKSVVPLIGDYDISVVIEALKLRECRVSLHVVFNPRDPSAFELALAEVDWESASVEGIIVNFVSRTLLWGAWVTHHFYAIVKGPDTPEHAKGAGEPGTGGGSASAAGGEARSLEDGGGGGVERGGGDGGNHHEGRGGCFKRLSPGKRRAKQVASNRDRDDGGDGGGGGGGGGAREEGAEGATGAVWYSLDSRLPRPQRLGGKHGLLAHLAWEVREHHGHVFVVGKGLEAGEERSDDRGQSLAAV